MRGDDVHFSSASEHWCTPPDILELVEEAQGGIDLDPCGNAHSIVPAGTVYTEKDDGLIQRWAGKLYANPPYGSKCGLFTRKMLLFASDMTCGTFLTAARPDTDWFHRDIATSADALCWWRGRITFLVWDANRKCLTPATDKAGKPMPAPFPSLFSYWGPDPLRWGRAFQRYGTVTICRGKRAGLYPARR